MSLNSNGDDKSILVSQISTDPSDVDVAAIAAELVHHVLGIHHFVTAAYEYRGDIPVAGNVVSGAGAGSGSGTVPQYRHPNRHDNNTKHQTNIDWDRFLDIFERIHGKSRVALAEYLFPEYNSSYLLHMACLCGAPEDVVQALLDTSLLPLTLKCGMSTEATPLHLACFAGCSANTVEKLLQADKQNITLFLKDAEDRIPLHVACEKGATGAASSAGIVKLLLDRDVQKESLNMVDRHGATPLQVAAQMSSESVIAHLLEAAVQADEMKDNVFSLVDLPQQLPLHRAFHRRTVSPGNIVHLLSTGASQANLTTKDRRGQLPIHIALKCGAGTEALKELIDNDKTGETFTATDMSHETPADLLIRRVNDGDESVMTTLEELAEADESRRFFGTEDKQGQTMLDALLKSVKRLSSGSLTELQKDAVLLMISCTLPKSGNYSYSLKKSQKFLGAATYGRIFGDHRFHKTLNIPMNKRSFTTFFMLDLYIRILLVTMFTIATDRAIQGRNDAHWAFVLVYLTSGYLLTWQLMLMRTHQLYYLREAWNLLDLLTLILVIISVSMLHSGIEHTGSFRAFNTLVGGLVWVVLITGALRSTFLPFSVFISGFTLILAYMIPFGIVTLLMLGSFADMYFKSTVGTLACSAESDTEDFCEYGSAFLKMYAMFVGGTDGSLLTMETDTNLLVLSIFYSFLFSIIMLNILVAVIFDAWGKVSPYGRLFYWRFRHQFLVETSFAQRRFGRVNVGFLDKMDQHLDLVIYNFSIRPERVNDMVDASGSSKAREAVLYMAEGIYLALWFVLGLLSVSVLWPRAFRNAIFCVTEEEAAMDTSTTKTSEPETTRNVTTSANAELFKARQQLAASQQELWEVKQSIDDLKRLVVGMSAK